MSVKTKPFTHDVLQVVKLGSHYQLKYLQTVHQGGFEENINFGLNDFFIPVRLLRSSEPVNDHKLKNNISRALTTCRNIALSNEWDYFITLTLDPNKYDRFDLPKFHHDLYIFFKKINRMYSCHIDYLLVPECHKNGAWHMHGVISNIPTEALSINDNGYMDFPDYRDQFGFCSLDQVRSGIAVSLYISKHLGKQLYNGVIDRYGHLYYCSRGLSRGEIINVLNVSRLPDNFHFQYESQDGTYKSSFFDDDTYLKTLGLL